MLYYAVGGLPDRLFITFYAPPEIMLILPRDPCSFLTRFWQKAQDVFMNHKGCKDIELSAQGK